MRKEIEVFDYMNDILRLLKKGVLLTTKHDGRVNSMTISWGKIGIEWNRLIFLAYVRTSRYTYKMLEGNPEFTVNFPLNTKAGRILGYCGTKSGRDTDKIADMGLTLVNGKEIDVPGIKELPLTLECKVIYKQAQDPKVISEELRNSFYPEDVSSDEQKALADYHTMFYGEVMQAYILE